MRSNKNTSPQHTTSFNEEKIAKLIRSAKYGLLEPTSYYLKTSIQTGRYTIEEVEEARRRYALTLNDSPGLFTSIFFSPNTMPVKKRTDRYQLLNVKSIDFDGCMFNKNYIRLKSKNRLIEANAGFIQNTCERILLEKYDGVLFLIGSNRQSLAIDKVNNQDGRGSCFPAIYELCDEFQTHLSQIPCTVIPYLLADTYGQKKSGENLKNALENNTYYDYSDWLFDDSKLTLIYAQIHYVASKHPQSSIVYDFYDDRHDILHPLKLFFEKNPDLLPNNLEMKLHHYAGNNISTIAVISGKKFGEIDFHHHQHIHLMIHSANLSFHRDLEKSNNVLNSLAGANLVAFKKQRLVKMHDPENTETYYSQLSPLENCSIM